MEKSELRKIYKDKRRKLTANEKALLDKAVQKRFLESYDYKNCRNILLYVSGEIEVDTHLIMDFSFGRKNVYCPKCHSRDIGMDFYKINSIDQLEKGMYGIYEPCDGLPEWEKSDCENTIIVVPGLSFDKKGYRLGFGKGYYDRFLEDFQALKIGLCYENCLCENLPADKNDVKTDKLVTEKMIYGF